MGYLSRDRGTPATSLTSLLALCCPFKAGAGKDKVRGMQASPLTQIALTRPTNDGQGGETL